MIVFALFSATVVNFILGGIVLMRDPKNPVNISFFFFSFGAGAWTLTNGLYEVLPRTSSLLYPIALTSYMSTSIGAGGFFFFWVNYLKGLVSISRRALIASGLIIVLASIASSRPGLLAKSIQNDKEIVTTSLFPLFGIIVVSFFISGFVLALYGQRHQQLKAKKTSLNLMIAGVLVMFAGGVLFNLVLPLFGNYNFVALGPLFTFVANITIATSIIRHGLFDIRAVLARSFAYLITALFLFLSLAIGSIFLTQNTSGLESVSFGSQLLLTIVGILVGASFYPFMRYMHKISNRLFFSDTYSGQEALDRISGLLINEHEISALIDDVEELLSSTIKPNKFDIRLRNTDKSVNSNLLSYIENSESSLIIRDELEDLDFIRELDDNNFGSIMKLEAQGKWIASLYLGSKKNGRYYTTQDKNLLKNIGTELALAIQNANRFEEIQRFNNTLQEKIEKATKRLRMSNQKLQALDEAKDEFISMASHQLRTPLTSVKGYVSMVLEGDAGKISKRQKELLESAFTSSQRMVYLISDLLNVSRLKTGKFVIDESEVDLSEIVNGEYKQLIDTAKMRKVDLIYKKPKTYPKVRLDETKIRQVIMNFIDNAIYYTPSGGRIDISLEADENSVTFLVEDNGIGVPKKDRPQLFTKFYRANNARRARPDGTGLGLYMAKKVIVAQGGSIIFTSKEGVGSKFGFSFPLSKVGIKPDGKKLAAKAKSKKSRKSKQTTTKR